MAERRTRPISVSFFFILALSFNTINGATFNVFEDVQVGSTLSQSLPAPAAGFHYSLFDGGDTVANSLFGISATGKITVKKGLKYIVGERNKYELIAIKRKDGTSLGGTPETVHINVVDVNNHDPVFKKSEYNGHISEGLPAGSAVHGLEDCFATDEDSSGISRYIIESSTNNNLFRPTVKDISGLKLLVIETAGTLDRETLKATPFIDLQVKAVDGGSPARFSKATKIHIRILDKNDYSPVFDQTNWRATIQENSPIMTSVIKVKATDNDEGSNSQVYYYFEQLQDDFYIDPYTGVIYVAAPLSFSKKSSYKITVAVTDRAVEKPLKSTSTVLITVVDVAGYPTASSTNVKPEFKTKKFDVTIRSDMPVNAFVLIAKATDPDGIGNNNGQLTYSMTAISANPFAINPTSGVISVKSKLPASKTPLNFEVSVKDGGHLTAKVPVAISIRSINTNLQEPIFNPSTVNVNIKEDISRTTEVFKAYASDSDGLEYSIIGGSGLGRFVIDANTGSVTPKVTFKSRKVYDLYIQARDKNMFRLSSKMYARINVKYSDVARPVFSKAMYLSKVGEEESVGSFVTAVFADYPDPTKTIKYSVIAGQLGSTTGLNLDRNTGIITTDQKFDYEVVQKKYMEVKAEVSGMPALTAQTIVEVDIINKNDNIPVFSKSNINIKVPENMGYIPNLACLFATDRDGTKTKKLTYSITSGNEDNVFSIDSETGQLSVKNLDYEKKNAYDIKVQATDGHTGPDSARHVAYATVKVVVEDDKSNPEPINFGTYKHVASMQENTPASTTVKDMPVVGASGSFTCDFGFDVTPRIMSLFVVKTQASSCLVESAAVLKWSKKHPSYKFTVRAITKTNAMQFSTAELKVDILDQNDHNPVFTQSSYAASVPVSSKIGTSLLSVAATDEDEGSNGDVRFGLIASTDSNRFNVDPKTGMVSVRDNLLSGKQYKVTVRASDQGSPAKTSDIQVLISTHGDGVQLPAFGSQDSANLGEEVSMGDIISAKATLSGATIDYAIVGGNIGSVFNIDNNGMIKNNQKLDYETKTQYKVAVRATQRGSNPPLVAEKVFTVNVIDANDNTPQFNVQGGSIEVTIESNAPVGTVVSMYRAFDEDSGVNGKLRYTVGGSVPFTANPDSGIVSTSQDITTTGTYNFILTASDQGVPVKSSNLAIKVTVVAGTKPPSFTDTRFKGTIYDNTAVGKSVGEVSIKDNDPKDFIQYEIVYGNEDNSFCIDFTRAVYVQKPIDRDVVQKDNYFMTVVMKYKNRRMSTLFWVNVRDENDNSPVFSSGYGAYYKEISESSPKGTFIYTVHAKDSDKDLKGSVEYSLAQFGNKYSEDKFSINTVTGEITLNNLVDYEKLDKHVITVKAADKATPALYALKQIIVKVTDTNDEAPVFSNPRYEAEIRKDAKRGDKVLQVHASDLDSGKNGEVFYALTNDKYGVFKIDSATGLITLKDAIALVPDDSFNLAATATDKGVPAKSGQANVIVRTVTSDGIPKFALPKFEFTVDENTMLKGTATAISVDPLTYSIVSGNTGNRFKIDKDTGAITSVQALDAEQGMNYTLVIKAKDTSERSSTTQVIIKVKNINDNEPRFTNAVNGLIEKVITNKVVPGEVLVKVLGKDDDVGDLLTYEIIDKAQKEQFEIGPNSGEIKLKKPLTSLIAGQNFAEFSVRAKDRTPPQKTKDVKVRIVFANFRPDHTKIKKSVSETAALSSSPVVVDLPRIYPLGSYQIVYPKVHPFKIDAKTGEIFLAQKLDYEKVQSYDVVIQENNAQDKTQYTNYKIGISVLDANDNSPVFKMPSLKANINRNARIGTEVIKLIATDADSGAAGRVAFEIITPNVPFTVNPVTNQIEVSKMNSFTQNTYYIDVKASDSGIPKRSSDPVKIEITVGNDPPRFDKTLYKFSVSENANVDQTVGVVKARSLSGIAVAYAIKSGNVGDRFRVDDKGNVVLQRPLNYEDGQSSFSLVVEASEIASNPLKSTTNVIIQVENVNDNPPRFTQVEYTSAAIREDVDINTSVLKVTATDKDCTGNGVCTPGFLTYSTEEFTDTFRLDPISGDIRTVRKLDWDTTKEYRFSVKVEDSGKTKRSAMAGVKITLQNVNDNSPVFNPDSKVIYISERTAVGVVVAVVEAKDKDNDALTYSFVSGNEKNQFAIDPSSGKVTVRDANFFDYSFTLRISATDGKYTGFFTLTIYIDDKNDKTPVFKDCLTYKPTVEENMPVGTQVLQVSASDDDQGRNGMIEYSLLQVSGKGGSQSSGAAPAEVGSSATNNFVIDRKTGIITTNKKFDREDTAYYTVLAIARDGGPNRTDAERNSAACQLTIAIKDQNDNSPVFAIDTYDISVWDETPVDTVILQTSALDADIGTNAKIIYSLVGATSEFKIPVSTDGKLAIASSLKDKLLTYTFRVQAANEGTLLRSSVDVRVTIKKSKPPKFTQSTYSVNIPEDKTAGYLISLPGLKADSQSNIPGAKIVYNLPKGSLVQTNRDTFAINSETGVLKVAGELNYEVTKKYTVYVQAKDESNDMVTYAIVYINILDVNDNTPLFHLPKYEYVTVTEGQGAGITVGQVYASDKDSTTNAELSYNIIGTSDAFTIDQSTGKLKTKRTFDREKANEEKITIHVKATDKGTPPQNSNVYVTVKIIDINDNAPVFVQQVYNGEVRENVSVNHKVLKIQATDKDAGDNAKVQFYITGGNEQGHFSTSKATFEKGTSTAWIIIAKPLDRETKSEYQLTITATDSKFNVFAKANIKVLDANDNAPTFLKSVYTGSINEGSKSGVVVTTVSAVDKDTSAVQGPITYKLGKDAGDMFVIDSKTGVITTGDKEFDREKIDEYRFTVIATDGELEGKAIVKCTIKDINDEAPYFPGAPYTRYVKEGKPAGTVVGYVPAKDNDDPNAGGNAKITYTIEGNNNGFAIDRNTGLIKTLKEFDRESQSVYKITVRASDGGIPVQKTDTVVTIVVTDTNDNDPKFNPSVFKGKIKECASVGSSITKVTATDADDPNTVNAQLMYYVISGNNNAASYFHLNDRTGVVTVAGGLDFEKSSKYELKVGVKDRGVPQRPENREEVATVDIDVIDCNDNRPVFVPSSYKVSVPENLAAGSKILTVTAVDKDTGTNGEFIFKIVEQEKNFRFSIKNSAADVNKGIISLVYKDLDREAIPYHVFKVSASDKGIPSLTGYADVNVTLIDENDNGPHFDKPDYCGRVEENKLGYQKVVKIKVSDPDTMKYSCPCTFSIIKGDTSLFELKNADGNSVEIVTKDTAMFDREKKSVYTIEIAAFDRGKKQNVTFVKVDVLDKNDNEPNSGGSLSLLVNAYKGKFIGGPVGKIYITDSDEGSNDLYDHKLTSQSPGQFFSVDAKTGDIIAAKDVPVGVYKLAFRSTEKNRNVGDHLRKTVSSSAVVTVRGISEKQAKTSVAIRMTGLIKSSTCKELMYPEFEEILAKLLGVDKKRVTVFSAQEVKDLHRGVDIRFSVKKATKPGYAGDDSEYMDPINLIPVLNNKKAELEKATGGKVASVGVDPCAKETCQVGFCYNDIQPQHTYSIVTDDNGIVPANPSSKTFISINVNVVPICLAGPRKPKSCKDKPCLYGGKCTDLLTGGYSCSCSKKSVGPECQVAIKSFKTKNSYLWMKPFNYFYEGTLSFEFVTKEANGIILYQGPVSEIKPSETKDFLAVELVQGKLQISVNQGDKWRIFKQTIASKDALNDGVFHYVEIYKRGKFIRFTVDRCRTATIVESSKGSHQDRSNCEVTGTIGGPYRFVNGMNPLQLGGIKRKDLKYPPLTTKDSFAGCLRNVYDNGIMYDLSKAVEERDIGLTCPFFAACPTCYHGVCKMTVKPFICVCDFGWTGALCNKRVNSYHYMPNSYTEYSFPTQRVKRLTWQHKYTSLYMVQLRTKIDGYVVYEASSRTYGLNQEYSILEVVNKTLQYRYNVGDGAKTLILRNVVVGDGKWHNVTVNRRGNYATLAVQGKGSVSGTVGTHQLLDSDGLVYAGGVPSKLNIKGPTDIQGCLADYRVGEKNLDDDPSVEVKRFNVEKTCPCLFLKCLNGGICMAGSPPYCICPAGYTGPTCSILITEPKSGTRAVMATGSLLGLVVIVVIFLLAVVLAALLLAGKFAKKTVPVYVDDDPRDNIMPYHDEGAGEDDFHNYDLEKLLKHAGGARGAGLANGAAGAGAGAGGKGIEHEPLLAREDVGMVSAAAGVVKREKHARFDAANVESVDVARFITTRLAEADSEDAAYPRDTLLHYGYEGEGSDVDDLSELGDSEDESDDDEADFGFLNDWGAKFDNLNKIFNPPTDEFDEDV